MSTSVVPPDSGAPLTADFVTLSPDATLTGELVLTAGGGISITEIGDTVVIGNTASSTSATVTTHTTDGTAVVGYNELNATSGNVAVTLPTAVTNTGKVFNFKRMDGSGNTVTINTTSSQTIDGELTKTLVSQYESLTLYSNGTNWSIE